mmetsp:Transcript_118383/g.204820  ORF Transcript_118383/g.204820 Transcript_118383/m.204820 type:complete len:216 (+) Transcript_118383:154-801(+)
MTCSTDLCASGASAIPTSDKVFNCARKASWSLLSRDPAKSANSDARCALASFTWSQRFSTRVLPRASGRSQGVTATAAPATPPASPAPSSASPAPPSERPEAAEPAVPGLSAIIAPGPALPSSPSSPSPSSGAASPRGGGSAPPPATAPKRQSCATSCEVTLPSPLASACWKSLRASPAENSPGNSLFNSWKNSSYCTTPSPDLSRTLKNSPAVL